MIKKVLVTGANGFIGTHLLQALSNKNIEIHTIGSRETGKVNVSDNILTFNRYNEYDVVYHLAAITNPRVCEEDPNKAWETNVEGTRHIVNQLTEKQHLIYVSTSHVYDPHTEGTLFENSPLRPSNVYGLTKMAAEEYIRILAKKRGFKSTILRCFHTYGPGQKEGSLFPDVIKKIMTQEEVMVKGSSNIISPVYIDDVIEVLTDEKLPPAIYNVCGDCAPIEDVYLTVAKLLGKNNCIPEMPKPTTITRQCGNRKKIEQYKKEWISLHEGISRTVKSQKN